jgi:hypothetical protein
VLLAGREGKRRDAAKVVVEHVAVHLQASGVHGDVQSGGGLGGLTHHGVAYACGNHRRCRSNAHETDQFPRQRNRRNASDGHC